LQPWLATGWDVSADGKTITLTLRENIMFHDGTPFNAEVVKWVFQMEIDAGKSLGCQTVLVTTGPDSGNGVANSPDYTADTLLQAAQWIIKGVR